MNTVKRSHLSTVVIVCLVSIAGRVSAQHSGGHTTSERPAEQHESHGSQSTSGNHQAMDHRGAMSDMGTPTGMFASGTALEPRASMDANPMLHTMLGNWNLMLHAKAFVLTTQQSGPRGRDRFFSANWLMPMLSRQMGAHSLTFRTMLSLEPATVTDRRYPALFQTGETAYGLPIVDGQHPHDLFMEIAGLYAYTPSEGTKLFVYGGPVGEPSIGPPAYPHRTSASENPIAVLAHHQQDSTHIAYSVVNLGASFGPIQLEASTFHGREPNENRWNIDGGDPDSFASRLSVAPSDNWVGQFSLARINSPEVTSPDEDAFRMTSSIHYHRPLHRGHVASSLIWGRNKEIGEHSVVFNTYTWELTVRLLEKNWVWTRIENADRDSTLLTGETPAALDVEEEVIGRVQAYTLGYERDFPDFGSWLTAGLGVQGTFYTIPDVLKPIYGDSPRSVQVFLRFRTERK
ncbi:MAG: hypothetical protein EHM23_26435 [Acidobacteria bacterium]|nr:MAG: hypothetical protein EHM23_26435 [Acidobacteriota bacterium]